jgi:hypothetical protein
MKRQRKTKSELAAHTSANGATGSADPSVLGWQRLHTVESRPLKWLWPGRVPDNALTLIEGRKGVGKSTLLAAIAAHVTGGPPLPDQTSQVPRAVLWMISEEDAGSVVRPRLEAAGCEVDKVFTPKPHREGPLSVKITLPSKLARLEVAIADLKPRVVVMDPWCSYVDKGADINHEQSIRSVLEPLVDIGQRLGTAFLLTRHLRKGSNGPAIDQGMGGAGVGNVCRSILRVDRHPNDRQFCLVSQVSTNLGPLANTLRFRMEAKAGWVSLVWAGESSLDAEMLADASGDGGERDARADARNLLRSLLADGWRGAREVLAEAKQIGIGERTLRAEKSAQKIPSRRTQQGAEAYWEWGSPAEGWSDQ